MALQSMKYGGSLDPDHRLSNNLHQLIINSDGGEVLSRIVP